MVLNINEPLRQWCQRLEDLIASGATADLSALTAQVAGLDTDVSDLQSYTPTVIASAAHQVGTVLSVADYVGGAELDNGNFATGLTAAVAAAQAMTGGVTVFIPRGTWGPLTSTITLLGKQGQGGSITLAGAGMGATTLIFDDTLEGPGIHLDGLQGTPGDVSKYYLYGGVRDLSIQPETQAGRLTAGIYAQQLLFTQISRVAVNYVWDDVNSSGIWIDADPRQGASNSQNVVLSQVVATQCNRGFRLAHIAQMVALHCQSNQCRNRDIQYDSGVQGIWYGGMVQSTGDHTSANPMKDLPFVPIATGSLPIDGRSGTGATLSAPSAGEVTVTDLDSMSSADVGRWLTFTNCSTHDEGSYLITSYVSASSVKLAKPYGDGGTADWQVEKYSGGNKVAMEHIYHEGTVPSLIETYPPEDTYDQVDSRYMEFKNAQVAVTARGTSRVSITYPLTPPDALWVIGRNVTSMSLTDCGSYAEHPELYSLDDITRFGLSETTAGVVYAGSTPRHATVAAFLREHAIEYWDPRDPSYVSLSGTDVQSITGVLLGTVASPQNAGVYPQWSEADPNFNYRNVWSNVAGTGTTGAALIATLSDLSAYEFPGLFVVARLPSTATLAGANRSVHLQDAHGVDMRVGFNDTNVATKLHALLYIPHYATFHVPTTARTADTLSHGIVVDYAPILGADHRGSWATDYGDNITNSFGSDDPVIQGAYSTTVGFGASMAGQDIGVLDIACVGVLKHPLSPREKTHLLELAGNEWNLSRSALP